MIQNLILLIVVLQYSVLIVLFPFQLGDGALLPFISLLVAIGLSSISKFNNFKYKQYFFVIVFLLVILVSHFYGITLHIGALLTTNFRYFLILSIIPISVVLIIGYFIVLASFKWRNSTKYGLSIILIVYFSLVSILMFSSLLLYALSHHSV